MTSLDLDVSRMEETVVGDNDGMPRSRGRGSMVTLAFLVVGTIASGAVMLMPVAPEAVGLAGLVMMLTLIFLRVPIGIAMAVASMLGIWSLRGTLALEAVLGELPFSTSASWSLSVVPLFILLGDLLWRSGVTEELFDTGQLWLGRKPGGLAVASNVTGAGMSAVTGSTIATTYALGRSSLPGMLSNGYSPRLAIASLMAAGMPGQLIPPSVLLVIYAGVAEVPVGPQLLAGVIPGVLITALFCVLFVVAARITRTGVSDDARFERPDLWSLRVRSALASWHVWVLGAVIIVGMYSGFFTATEAAAYAVVIALLITVYKKGRGAPAVIRQSARDAVATSGAILLMLLGAKLVTVLTAISGLGAMTTEWLTGLDLSRLGLLVALIVFYTILGMFLDTMAAVLITVPLLLPTLASMDVDLIWFGIFVCILGEMALLTPPVGMLSFVIHGMLKDPDVNMGHDISLGDVFKAVAWIYPIGILTIVLLIAFPGLALVLT